MEIRYAGAIRHHVYKQLLKLAGNEDESEWVYMQVYHELAKIFSYLRFSNLFEFHYINDGVSVPWNYIV